MSRIAFVTPGVLPMLRQGERTVYGGSEMRAWKFARGLADYGFNVSIVGFGEEPVSADLLGPISVVTSRAMPAWRAGLRRLMGSNGATQSAPWQAANADVYVAFGVAEYNADLADWCGANNHPLLLFAGSDADFSADYRPGNRARNLWGSRCDRCYNSIKAATTLVVQTGTQQRIAKARFGRDAEVIANPVVVPPSSPDDKPGITFLWVGKAVDNKRPELALKVAEACPTESFVMILNDVGNGQFEKTVAAKPSNVEIVTSVPPSRLVHYFAQARALLCTSDFEGFPNTFLDAGCFSVPVISLSVDPDGVVAREKGGYIAQGDMDCLIGAVKRYAAEPDTARAAGRRLYDYVKREHDAAGRIAALAGVISRMAATHQPTKERA